MQYDPERCWLPFLQDAPPEGLSDCAAMARAELSAALPALGYRGEVRLEPVTGADAGWAIEADESGALTVRGGARGVLYGSYALLMRLAAGIPIESDWTEPAAELRLLTHWDNMDGSIERGYAGQSLFFRDGRFCYDPERLRRYGRLLASIGINAICLNNVNVHPPAERLITGVLLAELAQVAALFRPFGIRLLVTVDFALPTACGLSTADPLDEAVQAFWAARAAEAYAAIPDLIGFVVKADSEFRPGPNRYGRDHAEGANMLARALAPHGGLLFWRAFVYNCRQDWRDATIDRPKAAYETYAPLEGRFDENVVLQIKYGPYDFQPREPVSPLFYAMPTTRKLLELQITQEYTGQQIDLYYLLPLWQDIRAALPGQMPPMIGAVPNIGDDANWTGHDLAQANWFAYGLFAWYGDVDARAVATLWARLTFGDDPLVIETITGMLLDSRTIFENYTSPLGLGWMVTPHTHYGPSPEGYEYDLWGTYLRANREAIGIDRTARGTGFTAQYPPEWAALYDDPAACSLPLLLFFHRLPYDYRLPGGETLVQHVYNTHFEGAAQAEALLDRWRALEGRVPGDCFDRVQARLLRQIKNAREWRDVVNTYFYRYSGVADARGRKIYP